MLITTKLKSTVIHFKSITVCCYFISLPILLTIKKLLNSLEIRKQNIIIIIMLLFYYYYYLKVIGVMTIIQSQCLVSHQWLVCLSSHRWWIII